MTKDSTTEESKQYNLKKGSKYRITSNLNSKQSKGKQPDYKPFVGKNYFIIFYFPRAQHMEIMCSWLLDTVMNKTHEVPAPVELSDSREAGQTTTKQIHTQMSAGASAMKKVKEGEEDQE